jgi:HlyD family secretion protein
LDTLLPMKSRWIRAFAFAAALVLAALALRSTIFKSPPVPVTVFRVAAGRVEETVTNSKAGTVKTRRRALLSPEIGGRVEQLAVRDGDRVGAGQVLMRLADGDYAAEVALRERALAAAAATRREVCLAATQAEREYQRYQRLQRDEIVSQEHLDQLESQRDVAVAACEAAQARLAEAEAALGLARVHLAKTVLRAPFAGVVAEVSTEVGEWITPSPPGVPLPPVIELIDTSEIYVSAPLDEVDVARIRVGQPVRITLDAYPGREFPGRLTRIAPYVLDVEQHSRTVVVEVAFDDAAFAASLLPGTSADVEVILDAKDNVLRIPSYALIEGNRVLVVDSGTLASRRVETGLRNWAFTEITSGLAGGERVVVSLDRADVKEGARARIAGETVK